MKNAGHTKTLFIQGGKYKWACRYDHCIECKTVKFKHKGRGLCTSCWEKERDKNPKRKEQKQNAGHNWHTIHKPRKPHEEWKPMGQKAFLTPEDKKAYMHGWYMKWRTAILTMKKGIVRKKIGLPYVEYMGHPLPFETLGKPFDMNMTCTDAQYDKWKADMILFEEVKKFINK